MKVLNKFKQLSRDIKLIIITTLIVSCVGVYAAGTCIISVSSDDVTYGNATVKAALDELYSMAENYCPPGYECKKDYSVIDCNNNKIHPTVPNNLSGLARLMAENAYLDNGKSEFVSSCRGVRFNAISSDTNGKGIYEIASTKNDQYPIYYYRGAVDNNNVKFAGFCWKAIRTTDTGGVKLIYNGAPDGSGNCTNTTGTDTQIGICKFNPSDNSPADVGYMYGTRYEFSRKTSTQLEYRYLYGNDVTYSNGTYTLVDTMTTQGTWTVNYNKLNNNHYTCFSTGTTCSSVYYIYNTGGSSATYITLTNGKKVEDALDEMLNESSINTTNSIAKTQIDNWYNSNLTSYTSYIEDTIYCNDRSISQLNGWNPNGGNTAYYLIFGTNNRTSSTYTPTLLCSNIYDRFTVSSTIGNGALTYPVGLITGDEVMYAGATYINEHGTSYLNTDQVYWLLSPSAFSSGAVGHLFDSYGRIGGGAVYSNYDYQTYGLRPVISLKSTDIVESGDGTSTNPYVIKTN